MCLPQASTTPHATGASAADIEKLVTAGFIPKDKLSQDAYAYASQHLHPAVLNHSLRVYIYASRLAAKEASKYAQGEHLSSLFTACIFHDIGTVDAHDGPQRFEVEGADAASTFLKSHGVADTEAHEVWIAIALHTSPGIGERITELARIVRTGVLVDFKRPSAMSRFSFAEIGEVETLLPRVDIEKILADAVVDQALRQREKAPSASWPGVLLQSKLENPDWNGVNKAF